MGDLGFFEFAYRNASIFQISFLVLFQYVQVNDLTRFVYIGVDTRIIILCLLELDILAKLYYQNVYLANHCIIYKIRAEKGTSIILSWNNFNQSDSLRSTPPLKLQAFLFCFKPERLLQY